MIKILIPTIVWSRAQLMETIRDNPDGEKVMIYGTNAFEGSIPKPLLDGWAVVHKYGPEFIDDVLEFCISNEIDVIIPTFDTELMIFAQNKERFEREGIRVSSTSVDSLRIVGDKVELARMYPDLMPKQKIIKTVDELHAFAKEIGYPENAFCIKKKNGYGGRGFAIVHESKSRDMDMLGTYCGRCYIDLNSASRYVEAAKENGEEIICQEFVEGVSYSTNALAVNGKLMFIAGYKTPMIQEGSALSAMVEKNDMAFEITKRIIEDTGYDGNLCPDFVMKDNGEVRLLEVNARINSNYPLVAKAGLPLMWYRIKQLLGENIEDRKPEINWKYAMRRIYHSVYYENE